MLGTVRALGLLSWSNVRVVEMACTRRLRDFPYQTSLAGVAGTTADLLRTAPVITTEIGSRQPTRVQEGVKQKTTETLHAAMQVGGQQQGTESPRTAMPSGMQQLVTEAPDVSMWVGWKQQGTESAHTAMLAGGRQRVTTTFHSAMLARSQEEVTAAFHSARPAGDPQQVTAAFHSVMLAGLQQQGTESLHTAMPSGGQQLVAETTSIAMRAGLQQQGSDAYHSAMPAGGQHRSRNLSRATTGTGKHLNLHASDPECRACWVCRVMHGHALSVQCPYCGSLDRGHARPATHMLIPPLTCSSATHLASYYVTFTHRSGGGGRIPPPHSACNHDRDR